MGLMLDDGARVAVMGGGPAGSFFAHFLLRFAERMEMDVAVDVFEPRDFTLAGSGGCNMCGGIVSETLIQSLATEGINLPGSVVQRGIDSYVLHTEDASTRIDTPLMEKRIAAIHRGGGPRDIEERRWGGLDGYLQSLARQAGANIQRCRVSDAARDEDGRLQLTVDGEARSYDLLVGATGINSGAWALYEQLGIAGDRPESTKAYITEIKLGEQVIEERFGNAMHIFFLKMNRVDCAAIIPKGDFVTVCLLGDDIDRDLVQQFLTHESVKGRFPESWMPGPGVCHCSPKINIREASVPYTDRVVLIGDCGATRLYKDGIGAAYRTAKAAARTAIFSGVAASDFDRYYRPVYDSISGDNRYGKFIFSVAHHIKAIKPAVRGVTRMTAGEQRGNRRAQRMSLVLWDMFTGSAPYGEIFWRTLDPRFVARFAWNSAMALALRPARREG